MKLNFFLYLSVILKKYIKINYKTIYKSTKYQKYINDLSKNSLERN